MTQAATHTPGLRISHPGRMTFDPMQWQRDLVESGQWSRLKPGERSVLIAMLSHDYHQQGQSRATVATLAAEAGLSERRVPDALQGLCDASVIVLVSMGGGRLASVYEFPRDLRDRIHNQGMAPPSAAAGAKEVLRDDTHVTPALTPVSPQPRHVRHPTPDAHVTPPLTPTSPYSERIVNTSSTLDAGGAEAAVPPDDSLFDGDDAVLLLTGKGFKPWDAQKQVRQFGARAVREAVSEADRLERGGGIKKSYSGAVISFLNGKRNADSPAAKLARSAQRAQQVQTSPGVSVKTLERQAAAEAHAQAKAADDLLWSQLDEPTRAKFLGAALSGMTESTRQLHEKFKADSPMNRGLILTQARAGMQRRGVDGGVKKTW